MVRIAAPLQTVFAEPQDRVSRSVFFAIELVLMITPAFAGEGLAPCRRYFSRLNVVEFFVIYFEGVCHKGQKWGHCPFRPFLWKPHYRCNWNHKFKLRSLFLLFCFERVGNCCFLLYRLALRVSSTHFRFVFVAIIFCFVVCI